MPGLICIQMNVAVFVEADKWQKLRDEILDEAHAPEPSVGFAGSPAITAADVELDDMRDMVTNALEAKMLSSLEPSVVCGIPHVTAIEPAATYDPDTEDAF